MAGSPTSSSSAARGLSRFHSRSRIASAGPRSAASPLACSRVTLSPSSSRGDQPFAGDVGAVDVEAAGRELDVLAHGESRQGDLEVLVDAVARQFRVDRRRRADRRLGVPAVDHGLLGLASRPHACDLGNRERVPGRPIEVDRRERLDERLGALPEPRRPVGVGIRARRRGRWCGFEHGQAGPAVDAAEVAPRVGRGPSRDSRRPGHRGDRVRAPRRTGRRRLGCGRGTPR